MALGAHYWLTNEQQSEVLDAIEDRIERLTLLIGEVGAEAAIDFADLITILRQARAALLQPVETVA